MPPMSRMAAPFRDARNKRTRFPCLETARGMVATTVSVLTVVVVVMVTRAALRPVDSYTLSIIDGMDSFPEWSSTTSSPKPNRSQQQVAERVRLRFGLQASNPSGRKEIRFDNLTLRVFEMPHYPSFDGMSGVAAFDVTGMFSVKKQGVHKLLSSFNLTDHGKLSHIANTYGARGTFKAMVLVDSSISDPSTPDEKPYSVGTYYCWPVLVGWTAADDSPDDGVPCMPKNELSVDVDSLLPRWWAAAPAPAPIAG